MSIDTRNVLVDYGAAYAGKVIIFRRKDAIYSGGEERPPDDKEFTLDGSGAATCPLDTINDGLGTTVKYFVGHPSLSGVVQVFKGSFDLPYSASDVTLDTLVNTSNTVANNPVLSAIDTALSTIKLKTIQATIDLEDTDPQEVSGFPERYIVTQIWTGAPSRTLGSVGHPTITLDGHGAPPETFSELPTSGGVFFTNIDASVRTTNQIVQVDSPANRDTTVEIIFIYTEVS